MRERGDGGGEVGVETTSIGRRGRERKREEATELSVKGQIVFCVVGLR